MLIADLDDAKKAKSEGYTIFPLLDEFETAATPVEAYRRLDHVGASFLLESREGSERQAHYSFIGTAPRAEIYVRDGHVSVTGEGAGEFETDDPDAAVRKFMERYRAPGCAVPFCGGAVGYFCFEYFKYGQKIDMPAGDMGDARLWLFDEAIVYDNPAGKTYVISNIPLDGDLEEGFEKAKGRIEEIEKKIEGGEEQPQESLNLLSDFEPEYSKEQFCEKVERAKRYIKEGDIFQCVPSNTWRARARGSMFPAYMSMRDRNPSPYMIYIKSGDLEIAGASPETLVKKTGDAVETFPIAGTRRRGRDEAEERKFERELRDSEKENSEHDMLVDLGRNDLGKICKFGTVEVCDYKKIFKFSNVMHVTSRVRGTLSGGKGAIDALRATLPAGTLSGAPKRRAVEIIRELGDYRPRGLYGGAVGYISYTGDGDYCIAIRCAIKREDVISCSAGAGIVDGSVPEEEFRESLNKASAAMDAVKEGARR